MTTVLSDDLKALLEDARSRAPNTQVWAKMGGTYESTIFTKKGLPLGGSYSPLFVGGQPNKKDNIFSSKWPAIAAGTLITGARLIYVDELLDAPETETLNQWVPLLESVAQAKESLVIVSPFFSNKVLTATLAVNRIRGVLDCAVVKPGNLSNASAEALKLKLKGVRSKDFKTERESLALCAEVWLRRDSAVAFFADDKQNVHDLEDITVVEIGGKSIPDINQRMELASDVIEHW